MKKLFLTMIMAVMCAMCMTSCHFVSPLAEGEAVETAKLLGEEC